MANEIDLSKILVKSTATAEVEADFDGEKKKYTIRALTEGEKRNFFSIASSRTDPFRFKKIFTFLLSCGLDIDLDVAEIIFDHNPSEATRVGDEVFALSDLEGKAKAKEAEEAEKNSETPEKEPAQK